MADEDQSSLFIVVITPLALWHGEGQTKQVRLLSVLSTWYGLWRVALITLPAIVLASGMDKRDNFFRQKNLHSRLEI